MQKTSLPQSAPATAEIGHSDRPLVPMQKPLVYCIGGRQASQSVQEHRTEVFPQARLARPSGSRRHFRPFIEDVDDRLPDLIQEGDSCQKYPLSKETFF